VDPVTRVEGHLKIEVTIDTVLGTQQVTDARCTGTLFRGFENILVGRDPKDAPYLTQRICGVCPVSHGLAATLALEDAAGLTVPSNARILRNLVLASNFLQSHILHFYLLASLDYIRGPPGTPWTPCWNVDLMRGQSLQQIQNSFAAAVAMRRQAHEMGAIFGGKLPSPPTYQAGGFTTKPTPSMISAFSSYLGTLTQFINDRYVPDVQLLKSVYADYAYIGSGPGNLLAYGVFDLTDDGSSKLLGRGLVHASAPTTVQAVSTSNIAEMVTNSWYADSTNNLNPANGSTVTADPAAKTNAYSWLKSPRYCDAAFETGPLARMWVNGDYRDGISVMDRHVARALEAQKIANAIGSWLNQLVVGGATYTTYTPPSNASGVGLTEAPRGALGHWVSISTARLSPLGGPSLSNYQIITPTCWNASPRDTNGLKGPLEQALIGTPVANAAQPIEVLRVIHSFDPCMACAVHVMRPHGKPVVIRNGAARSSPRDKSGGF
ncbi:MAG TPA: nickel-dependent hydrogenase large subunit, partial [Anaeromyxobacteraceae bacterium]|nr:nickel-dependent hydrogenase large subunit [Anaeromyxobacteraceae bacterium]